MHRTFHFVTVLWWLCACGSEVATTGAGGSSQGGASQGGGGSASTGQGGFGDVGGAGVGGAFDYDLSECDTDAECPGGECVDLHGGYRVCKYPVVEATACLDPSNDECACNALTCANPAKCLEAPLTSTCGGAQPLQYNVCAVDECSVDAECPTGTFCAPAGTVGNKINFCMTAQCSGICGQESPRPCALVRDPCCQNPVGFYCIPKGGCRTNQDCPDGHCAVGVCQPGGPPCPP